MTDLQQRLDFIEEIDKLKTVLRRTRIFAEDRLENSAEHSWHVTMMAFTLEPYAAKKIDINKVIKMLLVHDIVEIDAGDTFAYDEKGNEDKLEREIVAAERLFGLLPTESGEEMKGIWLEFEAGETEESKFANSIDRFLPILHNYKTDGYAWKKHGITRSQVFERNKVIKEGCPSLWRIVENMVEDGVSRGILGSD